MKIRCMTVLFALTLVGCGDYEDVTIPKVELTQEQGQILAAVPHINFLCAAISRYSNDIGSPLEDRSYLENATTAIELYKRSNLSKDSKQMDAIFQKLKSDTYDAVIQDLNVAGSLQEYYDDIFPTVAKALNVKKLDDCADVSAVTRRVLDPYLIH
ncbi:hypothetical protein [Vibrio alginolyticus]|uniref:hypothetical protein n=1 Tax=Vibrio alginolyticus TaxID=663 RepID=UPI00384DB3E4